MVLAKLSIAVQVLVQDLTLRQVRQEPSHVRSCTISGV